VIDLRRGSEGAAVAAIEEVVGEELDRPVRWGRCRVLGEGGDVVGAPSGDAQKKRTEPEAEARGQMRSSKGRGCKVIRAKDAAADADPATEDPIPRACR
jgi:hypothetical protein